MKNFILLFTMLMMCCCGSHGTEEADLCDLASLNLDNHKCYLLGDYIEPEWCRGDIHDAGIIGGVCFDMVYHYYECKSESDYPCSLMGEDDACSWYLYRLSTLCPKCWDITRWERRGEKCI